ncbi:MAG: hypothetical protein ACRD50_02725 [Candidatus Acidiferrales bacterium]
MQARQIEAFLSALSFLGTLGCVFAAVILVAGAKLIGEKRLRGALTHSFDWIFSGRGLTAKISLATGILLAGYFAALLAVSIGSHEWTLPSGEEKYFCEVDCHLAYSTDGVSTAKTLGQATNSVSAAGVFYIVSVRTRFNEKTISEHRGNGPLQPSPRVVTLVDEQGRRYEISNRGEEALEETLPHFTPLTQELRPGESYSTPLAFDVPSDARNLRLLIESPSMPSWIGKVAIGDEESFLHKKVFLSLGPVSNGVRAGRIGMESTPGM